MKRKLAITFTLILVLAVLTGCMSPKSASMLGGKPNQPSIEQETQTSNPPSTEPETQPSNPPSTEPKTQPSNPPSTEPKTPPLNPPSKEQETPPLNPPVPGEGVALKINSLDKLNYYGALRMIAGTPMASKQSMADDSYGIVLLAGGVGNDREEAPTVPDTTELTVALPDSTETAPTAPDSTELTVALPDATETAPTVPDSTELTVALPDATETAPTVPDATEPVSTEGPPLAPDNPTTTNPGNKIYYYQLKPNQPFNMKKVNMFQIELTDENGFLASKLGLGLVDVVISENCIWNDSLITFRNGDQFFSCLTNGRRLDTKTGGQQWNFSTHKYVEGFNIVKNFQQENYAFYIDVDAEGQIFAFECRGGDRVDQNVKIVSATRISTQGGKITVAELENYFNNGSTL